MKENLSSSNISSTNDNNINPQPIYHKEYKTINSTKILESIMDVFA